MGTRLEGLRVLVVDDNDDGRYLMTTVLHMAGASVSAVSSGAEALATLAESPRDVLISDITMPEMDGFELMAAIRRLEAEVGHRICAISVSGRDLSRDSQESREASFDAHLKRPVDHLELVATVARVCRPDPA